MFAFILFIRFLDAFQQPVLFLICSQESHNKVQIQMLKILALVMLKLHIQILDRKNRENRIPNMLSLSLPHVFLHPVKQGTLLFYHFKTV